MHVRRRVPILVRVVVFVSVLTACGSRVGPPATEPADLAEVGTQDAVDADAPAAARDDGGADAGAEATVDDDAVDDEQDDAVTDDEQDDPATAPVPADGADDEVPPDVPCDAQVVAAAQEEAERQGEVITGTPATEEEAEVLRRSHLGLTAEESEAKAAREERGWRVGAAEGVGYPVTADFIPGRVTVTLCTGVVVDVGVEWG